MPNVKRVHFPPNQDSGSHLPPEEFRKNRWSQLEFSRVGESQANDVRYFFSYTEQEGMYAKGGNLTELVRLAGTTIDVIQKANPKWDGQSSTISRDALQYQLRQVGEVKRRVFNAMEQKKLYYENTWMGWVTKLFLRLFGLWNGGNTKAIQAAEDFLLRWDSRFPLAKIKGEYISCFFFPLFPLISARLHAICDTSKFFNYTPARKILYKETSNGPLLAWSNKIKG